MARGKQNPIFKNCKVTIFNGDKVENYKLLDIHGDNLEFEGGLLPVSEAQMHFDITSGGTQYTYHLDLPARLESHKLKELYRSTVINNIFSYDKNKPFDIFKFLPWLVIILLVLFK